MIPEIDTPTFPLRTFMKELKNQGLLARARWKNCKNILVSANEIQKEEKRKQLEEEKEEKRRQLEEEKEERRRIRKYSTYRKCSIALFLVASMSALFDNRCSSPSISHSSSMSPVLEC